MARSKNKKENKELVDSSIENEKQVEAPVKGTIEKIQKALLLNYSKITLRKRGLI